MAKDVSSLAALNSDPPHLEANLTMNSTGISVAR